MRPTRRTTLLAVIVGAALVLGIIRDFLFANLNYQIDHLARRTAGSHAHSTFQGWVQGWDLSSLSVLKWSLALTFIGAMGGLCIALSRVLVGSNRYSRLIVLLYLTVGLLALLLHGTAVALHSQPLEFVAVKVLHTLQYPVPLLFIWVAHRLARVA